MYAVQMTDVPTIVSVRELVLNVPLYDGVNWIELFNWNLKPNYHKL